MDLMKGTPEGDICYFYWIKDN